MTYLNQQKQKLEKKKKDFEKQLEGFARRDPNIKGNWESKYPNFSQKSGDLSKEADEVEEYEQSLPVEHSLEQELEKVNQALEKIQKGSYGMCSNCKKKISKKRLEVLPEADTCINCNKK